MRMQQDACAFWPRGTVDASFYEPVQSSIPTLIMSGEIDPVTPPVWGEAIAKTLPNSKHIVMPGTGHTAGGTGCGRRLIKAFIDAARCRTLTPAASTNRCGRRAFVTPAGPDPTAAENLRESPAEKPSKGAGG